MPLLTTSPLKSSATKGIAGKGVAFFPKSQATKAPSMTAARPKTPKTLFPNSTEMLMIPSLKFITPRTEVLGYDWERAVCPPIGARTINGTEVPAEALPRYIYGGSAAVRVSTLGSARAHLRGPDLPRRPRSGLPLLLQAPHQLRHPNQ